MDTNLEGFSLEWMSHLWTPPYLYALIATLFLFAALLYLRHYRRTHRPIVPFDTEGGKIEIAPHTLKSLIQYAANSVEGVEKATSLHTPKRNRIAVHISIQLRATAKLTETESLIKERVRTVLYDQFGMQNVDPINIKVTKVVGEPVTQFSPVRNKKPSQETMAAPPAEPEPPLPPEEPRS